MRSKYFKAVTGFVVLVFIVENTKLMSVKDGLVSTAALEGALTAWTKPAKGKLSLDWTHLPTISDLARRFEAHQANCSVPLADFRFRNRYGLGSDLHVWTQALCNSVDDGLRIRSEFPWIYADQEACRKATSASSIGCYFPNAELTCASDASTIAAGQVTQKLYKGNGNVGRYCPSVLGNATDYSQIRAAGMEYLFSSVSQVVVEEAERQLVQVFPPIGQVPDNLITVHIRWGDKKAEMKLVPTQRYIEAVEDILERRPINGEAANIFLATEDPQAVLEFGQTAENRSWNVYVDQYFHDLLPHRIDKYNGNPTMTKQLQGKPGLVALGSLLVAMEARDFVLTTASNWSRLMNELRKNILDPRCGGCTHMIDLRPGEW